MPSRLLSSVLFAGIFAIGVSSAQQGAAGVPIPRMTLYAGIIACGPYGQAYLPSIGYEFFVLRVSLDGSSLTFRLPDKTYYAEAVAPYAAGVNILSSWRDRTTHTFTRAIYNFDNLGNLVTQHPVPTDLIGAMMATTSSGTTILVGHHRTGSSQKEDWKYGGLVLNADDRVVSRFELPSPPAGGTWTFGPSDRRLMTAGDREAYVLLHSNEPLATEIATISESGKLSVKTLPKPMLDDPPHIKWLVGPGVVVEAYSPVGGRRVRHFDEYDVKSGEKIASKIAPLSSTTPFEAVCYYGDSVTGLGGGSPDTPDALWLRVAKLQ